MAAAFVDSNGFMVGSQNWSYPPGNLAGDGPNRTKNPIPTDAPTQSTLAPVPPLAVKCNQVTPAPTLIVTVKNSDGSTASAEGLVPNTMVVIRNPDVGR